MSRLIDAEETYRVLTDYYHHRTEAQHEALREALERVPSAQPERCLDCINFNKTQMLIPQPEPQWIPCSEKYPEPDSRVLVIANTADYYVWDCMSNRADNYFWGDESGYYHDKYEVVAWMPLPEPYRKTEPQQVTSKLASVENPTVSACESTMSQPNGKLKTEHLART